MPFDNISSLDSTDRLERHHIHLQPWDAALRLAIVGGLLLIVFLSLRWQVFQPLLRTAREHQWTRFIVSPGILWMAMGMLMLLFRTLLWFRYRTPPAAGFADAPVLTVVIPAYKEGPMVAQSIDSVAAARYPRERLEIFVVDDGSRDDTWEHIAA
ncbi:MAG: glycosyltransferase, partial [Gammaproteobacteria bacterium]